MYSLAATNLPSHCHPLFHCPGMEIYELKSLSRVGSTSMLAPDWLQKSEQPIRSQVSKLSQLLTMSTTIKFPLQHYRSRSSLDSHTDLYLDSLDKFPSLIVCPEAGTFEL